MKTAAEKSSSTPSRTQQQSGSFFSPANGGRSGDFFAPAVQTKLTVGKEGDKFEQEADMMAEKAVQRSAMPNVQAKCDACEEKNILQRKPLADGITPFIQRKEMEEEPVQRKEEEEPVQAKRIQRKEEEQEEPVQAKRIQRKEEEEPVQAKRIQRKEEEQEEPVQAKRIQRKEEEQEEPVQMMRIQRKEEEQEEPVQAKAASGPRPDLGMVEWVLQDAKGLGRRLPDPVLRDMEAGYGVDLGDVRIHTDQAAVDMSQMLHAQAFTHGWDVFFNQHKYNPNTTDGKLLLAHELAHTIQQAKANGEALRPAPTRLEPEIPIVPDEATALEAAMQQAGADAEQLMEENAALAAEAPPADAEAAPAAPKKPEPKKAAALPPCKPTAKGKGKAKGAAPPAAKEAAPAPEAPAAKPKAEAGANPDLASHPSLAPQPQVAEPAPKCPAEDPAFKKAKGQVGKDAKKQASHEPAEKKRDEAMDASAMTTAEQSLQSGQDQQAENMEVAANPPQRFDRHEFKRKLKEKIESKMPETEDEANAFAGSGKLEDAKSEFKGSISEEKGKVAGPLEQTQQQPLPEGQNLKPDNVAVPDAKPADKPGNVPSGLAAPKPKTEAEISMEHKSKGLDDQMAQEGITEQQLAESEEPEFEQALQKKKDAQREIAAAPGHYRQLEEQQLAKAEKTADKETGKGLKEMATTKTTKTGDVFGGQKAKETATEAKQRQIKADIDRIYNDTEKEVTDILEALATSVETTFSEKVEAANETFKKRVRSRLDDHYGWFTFDDKIAEWAGLSDGVAHIFREEKENFLSTMDVALDEIATTVETELNKALDRIKLGRTQLENFKNTLSADELKFAEEMLLEAGEKFGELEASVNESQDELIETLSDAYVENVNKLQEEFDKINDELSASWIVDAVSFIGDVASAIKKLGQLLSSIATRIGQYISEILASPKRFFNNLVDGIKGGMDEFSEKIDTYLEQGFWMWLTGASSKNKIEIPKTMNVEGMFSLAAQILGISTEFIFARIKAVLKVDVDAFLALYQKADSVAAKVMEPIKILKEQGLLALWNWVKEEVSSKLDEIFGGLKTEIFQAIIKKFLLWVASLFIPGLGFIKLIQAAYKALKWLVDNIDRIVEIVNSFLDAIGMAVSGNVSGIKQNVIKALTNGVVIAIDFLAKLVGLGNFGDKLQRGIQKLKKPVHGAIDFVLRKARPHVTRIRKQIEKAMKMVKKGVKKGVEKGKEAVGKVLEWWKFKKGFKNADGEDHTLLIEGKGSGASLVVRSKRMLFEELIGSKELAQKHPSPVADAKKHYAVYKQKQSILITEGKNLGTQKKHVNEMQKALNGIMKALSEMDSLTSNLPKPGPQQFVPGGDPPGTVQMLNLSKPVKPGTPPKVDPTGWDVIDDYGLNIPGGIDHWVRFHLINEKLGGEGQKNNLVPAPNSTNQSYKKFETQVRKMVDEGTPKLPKVVWLKASVDVRHKGEFKDIPARISAQAGIYLPEKKGNTFTWRKEMGSVFNVSLSVTDPELSAGLEASLNSSGVIDLKRVLKRNFRKSTELTLIVNTIRREREKRGYKNKSDFNDRFVDGLVGQKISLEKAEDISDRIVGNPKIKV